MSLPAWYSYWYSQLFKGEVKTISMYVVDSQYMQFDGRNVIFARALSDPECSCYGHTLEERIPDIIKEGKPGYSLVDVALYEAAWTVYETYAGAFSWERLLPPGAKPELDGLGQYNPGSETLTAVVKKAARFYGASLVGISRIDHRWVYSHTREGIPIEIPDDTTHAVVMAIEMDPQGIGTTPALTSSAVVGLTYSKMAFLIACMGEFIRNLGYKAIQMGNDTALSIPLAVDAGLGELGRHGLLVTPQLGSRVRICKVFTDMDLVCDEPVDLGVQQFCKTCRKCAEACEVEAISFEEKPTFEPVCKSNNPGVLKWPINAEKCYAYWCENGGDCATCIAVCPFTVRTGTMKTTPEDFWSHL
jgi:epoxyqueuosine reductase